MKLGTLLLRDAIISLSQLEAALRTQVLYGGRLGTNLVELDFIDLTTLGHYLSQVTGFPAAEQKQFDAVDDSVLEWFGSDLADLYTAFPLGIEPDMPNVLGIALADPADQEALRQLATQCGQSITPYIAPELRLFYYLEKHYDVNRKARYIRQGSRVKSDYDDRRTTQAPGGIETPPVVQLVPKKQRDKSETEGEDKKPSAAKTVHVSFEQALAVLDKATHRNEIGDAIIEYASGRVEVAVTFLIRDANALGWRFYSSVHPHLSDKVEQLGLALGGTSVLQAAYDGGEAFCGGSGSAGKPIEKRLWEAAGTDYEPAEMMVVPIRVKRRVVNLIYMHGYGGEPIDAATQDEIKQLAQRGAEAYIRLIQATKNNNEPAE